MLLTLCCAFAARAQVSQDAQPLRLAEALELTLATHPELRIYAATERRLAAEQEAAGLRSPLALEAEVENLGHTSGDAAAEYTLSLATVLERGGKREARIAVARASWTHSRFFASRRASISSRKSRVATSTSCAHSSRYAQRDGSCAARTTVEAAAQRVQAGASPNRFASRRKRRRRERSSN